MNCHICLCIQFVVLCCFGWTVYEENFASHRCIIGKGSINLTFLDNSVYSSLILHQNSANGNFLTFQSRIFKPSVNFFVLSYITICWLFCTLDLLPMHDFITWCIGHLEHTVSLSYTGFLNLCNIKITFWSHQKSLFKYLNLHSISYYAQVADTSFPRFYFSLEFYHCQQILVSCFPWSNRQASLKKQMNKQNLFARNQSLNN